MSKFFKWYGEKILRSNFWILYAAFMAVCLFSLAASYFILAVLTGGLSVLVSILVGGYIVVNKYLKESKDV